MKYAPPILTGSRFRKVSYELLRELPVPNFLPEPFPGFPFAIEQPSQQPAGANQRRAIDDESTVRDRICGPSCTHHDLHEPLTTANEDD